jgi:hypothetical protein
VASGTAVRSTAGTAAPPVFTGTLVSVRGGTAWAIGLFSSATGQLLRVLSQPPPGASDVMLGIHGGQVYFEELRGDTVPPSVWRISLAGGVARLVRAGTTDYALSSDGRVAAYVATVNHLQTTGIVVANLVTRHSNTIVMVTNRPGVTPVGLGASPGPRTTPTWPSRSDTRRSRAM